MMNKNIVTQYVESVSKESASEVAFILKTVNKNELNQNLNRYIQGLLTNCKAINYLLVEKGSKNPKLKLKKQLTKKLSGQKSKK